MGTQCNPSSCMPLLGHCLGSLLLLNPATDPSPPRLHPSCTGEDPRRAKQLWRWLYYDNKWISSFGQTLGQQGGMSAAFCSKAEASASVDGGMLLEQVVAAQDGTKKLVFKLTEGAAAGEERIEGRKLEGGKEDLRPHYLVMPSAPM